MDCGAGLLMSFLWNLYSRTDCVRVCGYLVFDEHRACLADGSGDRFSEGISGSGRW